MASTDNYKITDNSTHDVNVEGSDIKVGVNFDLSDIAKATKYQADTQAKYKMIELKEHKKELLEQTQLKAYEINEMIKAKKGYYLIGITLLGIYLFKKK